MARIATALTISDGSERWGVVEVFDADGNITRSFPITAAQLAEVKAGGVPPLVLAATWRAGRAAVYGRPCLRGMLYVNPDGSAIVNLGRRIVANKIEQRFGNLPADKWGALPDGTVEVDSDILGEATPDANFAD